MDAKRFVKHRKKLLAEQFPLMKDKQRITKQLREIQKELDSWDRGLLVND